MAPVMNALGTNEIQLSVASAGTAGPFLRTGKLKALAIASNSRSPEFPAIPTTAEEGHPDLKAFIWFGLAARGRTPAEIVEKVSTTVRDIVRQPAFSERFITSLGWSVVASTPTEMDATIQTELPIIRRVIGTARLSPR